jgi:hypothetical protein
VKTRTEPSQFFVRRAAETEQDPNATLIFSERQRYFAFAKNGRFRYCVLPESKLVSDKKNLTHTAVKRLAERGMGPEGSYSFVAVQSCFERTRLGSTFPDLDSET